MTHFILFILTLFCQVRFPPIQIMLSQESTPIRNSTATSFKLTESARKNAKASNIKVVARFRPMNELEGNHGALSLYFNDDMNSIQIGSDSEVGIGRPNPLEWHSYRLLTKGFGNIYSFDRVFTQDSHQHQVYEYAAADIVQGLIFRLLLRCPTRLQWSSLCLRSDG